MFNRILVPLDGSSFGEQAVPTAVAIAKRTGGSLTLVHVHVPSFSSTQVRGVRIYDPAMDKAAESARERAVEAVAARVLSELAIRPNVLVFRGPAFENLIRAVDDCTADLIVMTTHGHGGPSRTWLGSITDRMTRETPSPLLLVRPHDQESPPLREPMYKRMLVPCDGSALAEEVLPSATALAKLFEMEIILLRVVSGLFVSPDPTHSAGQREADQDLPRKTEEAAAYLDEVAERVRAAGVRVSTDVVSSARPAAAILDCVGAGHVDLIAMTTHGRGGIRKLLLGSVADKLLRAAECTMLIQRSS